MLLNLENSIRIKVTGKCNRNCAFCHKEGDMENIDEIILNNDFINNIKLISKKLNIYTVSITGGEPLLYTHLLKICESLINECGINKISLTTNGTIYKNRNFWEKMKLYNLYKVNISVPEIIDDKIEKIFYNQLKTINILNELNIMVNLNIVVHNDFLYTNYVIKTFQNNNKNKLYEINLLPNLSNYDYSINVINEIKQQYKLKKLNVNKRIGTSNIIEKYVDVYDNVLFIKSTRENGKPILFNTICKNCNMQNKCQEGFYGIRLENRNGILYVRLCIHKNTNDVLMPISDFLNSKIINQMRLNWKSEVYNEKRSRNKNLIYIN